MTKNIVTANVGGSIKYDLDGRTIAEAILRLHALGAEYGIDARIDIGQEYEAYGSDREYTYVRLTVQREETDEEYEKRTAREKHYADMRAADDLAAYERVKRAKEGGA